MPRHDGDFTDKIGALPFSDVNGLLSASAAAEKQQAVVACIFPTLAQHGAPSSSDNLAQLLTLRKQLLELIRVISSDITKTGGAYIWHKESPSITINEGTRPTSRVRDAVSLDPHLVFRVRTGGECVEDEWLATYFLLKATEHFKEQQFVVSVENEDGQFLLIEAAAHLPPWITPETATNRVWLYDGHLHLITPHLLSQPHDNITPGAAIAKIRDADSLTRATEELETAALSRMQDYPRAAFDHLHHTLAYIPRAVAEVLAADPQLISTCVSAIQSRDVFSSRASSRMSHFPPHPADVHEHLDNEHTDRAVILTSVRMTRHLYAQLSYDRFFPPRQLGRNWQAAVEKYRMRLHQTPRTTADNQDADFKEGRWRDLGAKIWCGLEMAYDESSVKQRRAKPSEGSARGSMSADDHDRFIAALHKLGYFGDEVQGSAAWKTMELEATSQATSSGGVDKQKSSQVYEPSFSEAIDALRSRSQLHSRSPVKIEPEVAKSSNFELEDSDDWMYLTEEDLQEITASRSKDTAEIPVQASEEDAFNRLNSFTAKLDTFMTTRSDAQGALFEDEVEDDEDLSDDDLLFEHLGKEERELRARTEMQQRVQKTSPEERLAFLHTLIPPMTEREWTARPTLAADSDEQNMHPMHPSTPSQPHGGTDDFVTSIDRLAAQRAAGHIRVQDSSSQLTALPHLSRAQEELQRKIASQYMREVSASLSKQPYEGASDSDSDDLEQETSPEIRRQIARDYELESDEEIKEAIVGQEDVDLPDAPELNDEEELQNLLEFARTSLGLSKQQYEDILQDREKQGKYVPAFKERFGADSGHAAQETQPAESDAREAKMSEIVNQADTFDSVMDAMDARLANLQQERGRTDSTASGKSNVINEQLDPEEQELLSHLLKSGGDLPSSLWSGVAGVGQADNTEDMIKAQQAADFLESFRAQVSTSGPGSTSGPVEALMRRFGLGSLPADSDATASH